MMHRHFTPTPTQPQEGFTIVELMIATVIFSVVLLVITVGVLNFTHAYYSGVNSSNTQDTARSIVNNLAQAIEFSGTTISPTEPVSPGSATYYFCANNNTFIFIPGKLYDVSTPSASDPGLYQAATNSCDPTSVNYGQGRELLGQDMRVVLLSVAAGAEPRTYTVKVRLAYGDDDLLCAPQSVQDSCASNAVLTTSQIANHDDVTCRLQTGFQFCAVAGLTTTVALRVSSSVLSD